MHEAISLSVNARAPHYA